MVVLLYPIYCYAGIDMRGVVISNEHWHHHSRNRWVWLLGEGSHILSYYLIYLFVYIVPQPRAEILKLYHVSESTGGLLKKILLGPTPRISDSVGWGRSCELASLTSYQLLQLLLLLLVWKHTLKTVGQEHCTALPVLLVNSHSSFRPQLSLYYL